MRLSRAILTATVLISAGLVSACNPTLRSHGFRYPDGEVPELTVGVDSQSTVLATLGNPSTRGALNRTPGITFPPPANISPICVRTRANAASSPYALTRMAW